MDRKGNARTILPSETSETYMTSEPYVTYLVDPSRTTTPKSRVHHTGHVERRAISGSIDGCAGCRQTAGPRS